MAETPQSAKKQRFPGWMIFLALAVAILVIFPPGTVAEGQHARFVKSFLGLVIEALPFLLLGGLMAGVIDVLLPDSWLPTLGRRFGRLGLPLIAILSPILPLCECGVVGVGRGLLRKGLPLAHTVVYLLSAPILNPIVLFTTYLAFSTHPDVALYVVCRALGGVLVPVAIGLLIWGLKAERVLIPEFLRNLNGGLGCDHQHEKAAHEHRKDDSSGCDHDHGHDHHHHHHHHHHHGKGWLDTFWRVFASSRYEFTEMASWFVVGIAIAAGLKAFIGTDAIGDAAADPIWGAPLMMVAAFVLSLCSEVDAFVAVAFPNASLASVTAFLVFGPMIDIRLLLLYRSLVKGKWVLAFAAVITVMNLIYAWILSGILS